MGPAGMPPPPPPPVQGGSEAGFTFAPCNGTGIYGTLPLYVLDNQPICVPDNLEFKVTISGQTRDDGFIVFNPNKTSVYAAGVSFTTQTVSSAACLHCNAECQEPAIFVTDYDNTTIVGNDVLKTCWGNGTSVSLDLALSPHATLEVTTFCVPTSGNFSFTAGATGNYFILTAENGTTVAEVNSIAAGQETSSC